MKINFKKIATVLGSALMVGSTVGMAAAAAFPAPFVSNAGPDVAVVYGGGNIAPTDVVAATSITTNLQKSLSDLTAGTTTGGSTTADGDSVKLERTSDKFNLRDTATSVFVTSITKDNLPTLLASGTYNDDANEEYDYTQKIELGNLTLLHWSDSDYQEKTPTIGFKIPDSQAILNYTMDFITNPLLNASTLETTTITMMGKNYYVLDVAANTNKTTLLDSANSAIITEGQESTVTVGDTTYNVSVSYISSTQVKLTVNGQTTNSLANGGTQKLSNGAYVGVKEILFNSKDTGISKVEISIGTGKLELGHKATVKLNDESINEITSHIVPSGANLDKIVLEWVTDDEAFVTPTSSITIPGFNSVKVSMGAMNFPKSEQIKVDPDSSTSIELSAPIKDGTATFNILYSNASGEFTGIGKDSDNRLVTSNETYIYFNKTLGDKMFIASWNATAEAETYLLSASIAETNSANRTTITNEVTNVDICKDLAAGDTCPIGSVILTVSEVYLKGSNKQTQLNGSAGVTFNELYTKEGLKVHLPYSQPGYTTAKGSINFTAKINDSNAGNSPGSFNLYFNEEDKDGNLGKSLFNMTLDENTDSKLHVSNVDVGGTDASSGLELGDTKNYEFFRMSDLTSKVVFNTGGDEDSAVVTYAGDQAFADVFVTAPNTVITAVPGTVTGSKQLGEVLVKDTSVSTVSSKNLVVVGGSCINTVAAKLLGSDTPICGADFTTKTTVANGQYLIQVLDNPYDTGSKVAMLVAGYNAEDTVKAATYLTTHTVNATVGTKLVGTSQTEANVVTA